jgi:hypothetical protein
MLRDLIPARARKVVYAVLAFVVPVTTTAVSLFADGFQASDIPLLLTAGVSAAGFTLAAGNVKEPTDG